MTTSTSRRVTTTALPTTTATGPRASILGPTPQSTTTIVSSSGGDGDPERVVWLVVAVLVVIGLLISVLTWRYWWYTNPKRGYVRSRAVFVPSPEGDPTGVGGADGTGPATQGSAAGAPPAGAVADDSAMPLTVPTASAVHAAPGTRGTTEAGTPGPPGPAGAGGAVTGVRPVGQPRVVEAADLIADLDAAWAEPEPTAPTTPVSPHVQP